MAKKYYWLKFQKNFFKEKRIKKLRKIAGGDIFTIIYLKMLLYSVSTEGIIIYEGVEPTFEEEIALEIDEDPLNVRITVDYLLQTGLLIDLGENQYLLPEAAENIGSEGESAARVRKYRERQKTLHCNDEALLSNGQALHCNTAVTNCNTEKEIEKEKEKEIEIDKDSYTVTSASQKAKKPPKHKHGEYQHVLLADEELAKLNDEYGVTKTQEAITYLDEYIETYGKKYKNCYLVMKKWVFDAVDEEKAKKKNTQKADYNSKEEVYARFLAKGD